MDLEVLDYNIDQFSYAAESIIRTDYSYYYETEGEMDVATEGLKESLGNLCAKISNFCRDKMKKHKKIIKKIIKDEIKGNDDEAKKKIAHHQKWIQRWGKLAVIFNNFATKLRGSKTAKELEDIQNEIEKNKKTVEDAKKADDAESSGKQTGENPPGGPIASASGSGGSGGGSNRSAGNGQAQAGNSASTGNPNGNSANNTSGTGSTKQTGKPVKTDEVINMGGPIHDDKPTPAETGDKIMANMYKQNAENRKAREFANNNAGGDNNSTSSKSTGNNSGTGPSKMKHKMLGDDKRYRTSDEMEAAEREKQEARDKIQKENARKNRSEYIKRDARHIAEVTSRPKQMQAEAEARKASRQKKVSRGNVQKGINANKVKNGINRFWSRVNKNK